VLYLVLTTGMAFLLLRHIGKDVLPKVNGGQFQVRIRAPEGTRIERTEEKTLTTIGIVKDIVGSG
jgi:multidrug efflux pump subunit AcrB